MDLETRLAQALEENSHASHLTNGSGSKGNEDWIPTGGPKHTLTGHREAVNAVAFHPLYSVLASASDDCTVKIWDWESGELERTLKAHTKRVSDCQFNSKGTILGTHTSPYSEDWMENLTFFFCSDMRIRSFHKTLERRK